MSREFVALATNHARPRARAQLLHQKPLTVASKYRPEERTSSTRSGWRDRQLLLLREILLINRF